MEPDALMHFATTLAVQNGVFFNGDFSLVHVRQMRSFGHPRPDTTGDALVLIGQPAYFRSFLLLVFHWFNLVLFSLSHFSYFDFVFGSFSLHLTGYSTMLKRHSELRFGFNLSDTPSFVFSGDL